MKYFFSSDYHLGHWNIVRYCNRPFKSLEQMNETIIRNHNARVKEGDIVIHNGDFCLSGRSGIDTPQGRKLISSLKEGDEVYSVKISYEEYHSKYNPKILQISKVKKVYISHSKFRYKIELENGHAIETTESHPFAVHKGLTLQWIPAKNLKINDILFRKLDIPAPLSVSSPKKHYKLGYILGYIHGDGSIYDTGVDIQSEDLDGLIRIQKYIKILYNKKLKIKPSRDRYWRLKISCNIWNSIKRFDYFTTKNKIADEGWKVGFMAGFFDAEGSCTYQNHGWYIRIGNTNKKLYSFVKKLSKEKKFKILTQPIKTHEKYRTFYSFKFLTKDTYRFFTLFRPAIKRKYPDFKILANGIKIKKISKIYSKYKNRDLINYNLTVEPNNNFFVNGILVHNCFRNSAGGKKGEGTVINAVEWEKKLNGKLLHCKGNHDRNNSCKTIIEKMVIKYGGRRINIVHNPKFADFNYKINLVGHIHERWKFKRLHKGKRYTDCINIGTDIWNFMPVTFEEIMKGYHQWRNGRLNEKGQKI